MDPEIGVIRELCVKLAPSLGPSLAYEGAESECTWHGHLSNGKALELLALCSLAKSAELAGFAVDVPSYLEEVPGVLYERNALPRVHAAMPGVSGSIGRRSVFAQFEMALLPRMVISGGGRSWSVFREGFPLSDLMRHVSGRERSARRPDLIIVPGTFAVDRTSESMATYRWEQHGEHASIQLRTVVRDGPEVISHSFEGLSAPPGRATALVECSVRKEDAKLRKQLMLYLDEFGLAGLEQCAYVSLRSETTLAVGVSATIALLGNLTDPRPTAAMPMVAWISRVLGGTS